MEGFVTLIGALVLLGGVAFGIRYLVKGNKKPRNDGPGEPPKDKEGNWPK